MNVQKVNLSEKFSLFDEHWSPKIVGEVNDFHVKLAKLKGEFVWHHHEDVDELFLVVCGQITIELRDQYPIVLHEGELVVIPRGVEHRPVAENEAHVVLFERAGTVNTGNVGGELTVEQPDRI